LPFHLPNFSTGLCCSARCDLRRRCLQCHDGLMRANHLSGLSVVSAFLREICSWPICAAFDTFLTEISNFRHIFGPFRQRTVFFFG
jgi:hypothetical protein